MKTTKALCVSILMTFSLIVQPLNAETVKGTGGKKSAASKPDPYEMTDQDKKNGAVKSPYQSCEGFLLVEKSDHKGQHWNDRAAGKCDEKVSNCAMPVQVIPDTGMWKSYKGVKDGAKANMSSTVTAVAFLEEVRQDAIKHLTAGIATKEAYRKKCFGAGADKACKDEISGKLKAIEKELPAFRNAVATMSLPAEQDIIRAIASDDTTVLIDADFSNVSTFARVPKMAALSKEEIATAKKEYDEIFKKVREEYAKEVDKLVAPLNVKGREIDLANQRRKLMQDPQLGRNIRAALDKHRAEKLKNYFGALSRVQEMAYSADPKMAPAALAAVTDKVVEDAKTALAAMKKEPSKNLATEDMDSSLLRYAGFTQLIEAKLDAERKAGKVSSCAVATSVFNELQAVEGQRQMLAVGFAVGGMVTGIGFSAGLFGAAAVAYGSNVAIITGLMGGLAAQGMDTYKAYTSTRDEKAGLVKPEDALEARSGSGLGAVFMPLDFIGAGGAITATSVLAAKGIKSLAGKTVGKFATQAVEKGAVKSAANNSPADIRQLAATAAKSETVADANRVAVVLDQEARGLLGRAATVDDDEAFAAMARLGTLGDGDKPVTDAAKAYAERTKDMTPAQRKAYADQVEAVANAARGNDAVVTQTADRAKVAGQMALDIAADPELKGAAAILHPKSGWSVPALSAAMEVVRSAGRLAKGAAQAGSDAVGTRLRKALANINKKGVDSPDNVRLCGCLVGAQACAIKGASLDRAPASEEPQKLVACVANPENFATN